MDTQPVLTRYHLEIGIPDKNGHPRYTKGMDKTPGRYIAAFYQANDDPQSKRRWLVVDTRPSATAETATVIAECMSAAMAVAIATSLNPPRAEEPF